MYISLLREDGEIAAAGRIRPNGVLATFAPATATWGVIIGYAEYTNRDDAEPLVQQYLERPVMVRAGQQLIIDLETATAVLRSGDITQRATLTARPQQTRLRG